MTNFWTPTTNPTGTAISNTSLYPGGATQGNIDLRAELHKILFGDIHHPPQGHKILVRHMTSQCPCMIGGTGSSTWDSDIGEKHKEPDTKCSVCHGEGFVYSDVPYTAYRSMIGSKSGSILASYEETPPGIVAIMGFNYFFEYSTPIADVDKIVELKLDLSGGLPVNNGLANQIEKFKIIQLINYRADNGRVEFIRAICEREEW
jgi:hypothetical protein